MFLSLPTYAWIAIAVAVTPVHITLMRWVMPTTKGKKSVSFIPLALGITLILYAVVKSYPLSITLYLYTSILLIFLIMLVPVKKWVAADILEQEQNPHIKVKMHTPSVVWITFSMLTTIGIVVGVWLSNT